MERTAEILAIANQVFNDEISGLRQVQAALGAELVHAVDLILACHGKVIVSGMGKSGHVGNKIAATLASTGTSAFFMHPAEALHGDLGMLDAKDLLIAISYSGESNELSSILPLVRHKQVKVVAITGNSNSTLAKLSDCVLSVEIDKEACPHNLAPTTSTSATLVLGDALALVLLSLRNFQPEDFALSHPGGSLGRRLLTKVDDIMHQGERLPLAGLNSRMQEVVVEITSKGLGLVAIVDEQNCLLGIITDGDLRRVLDSNIDIRELTALDIMSKNPKTIHPYDMAITAVDLVEKYKISGVVVVDDANKVVGAFNMHDLFAAKLL